MSTAGVPPAPPFASIAALATETCSTVTAVVSISADPPKVKARVPLPSASASTLKY